MPKTDLREHQRDMVNRGCNNNTIHITCMAKSGLEVSLKSQSSHLKHIKLQTQYCLLCLYYSNVILFLVGNLIRPKRQV